MKHKIIVDRELVMRTPTPFPNPPQGSTRITLTKLRLSNHKPEERICPICKKDVEDEIHFLTLCTAYQEKRSTLFEYLKKEYRISVNRIAADDVFLLLINPPSKNKPVQNIIAKYVFECYEKKRSLVL